MRRSAAMRLGGPVFGFSGPEEWARAHVREGYSAAYWPNVPDGETDAYVEAARATGLVIAEVGAWSNPLSPNEDERKKALANCKAQLAVAERVGARCCVNIVGSLGPKWDGPCARDLTGEAFEAIVATTREIVDTVQPKRTFYTLETMPWMYPDSADSYVRLLNAIDRPECAVHLDPTNLVNCPERYFRNDLLIRDAFAKLGPLVRSCHAKDIRMTEGFMVHLDEVPPGTGVLDYRVFLREAAQLEDVPVMLEHLRPEEYPPAARYIRTVAEVNGLRFTEPRP
jgi:sugar phosphate isomerase/epimerase